MPTFNGQVQEEKPVKKTKTLGRNQVVGGLSRVCGEQGSKGRERLLGNQSLTAGWCIVSKAYGL